MTSRVGINSFGRRGRQTLRSACLPGPDIDEFKAPLDHSENPIVSSDIVGTPHSAIVR
jgi:glyceraldehyde-3-phosphate dehydrogenase/erythrose-4-phosphate dehydrogenase